MTAAQGLEVRAGGGQAPIAVEARPEPCTLVIFGVTGDLTERKLVPALYQLEQAGALPETFRVVGYGRRDLTDRDLRARLAETTAGFSRTPLEHGAWSRLEKSFCYVRGQLDEPAGYRDLAERLAQIETEAGLPGNRLYYLAVPPDFVPDIVENLDEAGLLWRPEGDGPWCRIVVEKPFGRDLESARDLNALLANHLAEEQIYRIDHYLGKETVQNIMVFRFGNSIFEPVWNRKYVDHVQITAAETVDAGGRASYYQGAGVMRDMVQNHLLQLLTLCAMEPPVSFRADDVRDEKAKVLRALRPLLGADLGRAVVLGQYEGYTAEEGVPEDSRTPTWAGLEIHVDNWRWQGVPFYLRTGKAMARRLTEIRVHFKTIPFCLFGSDEVCQRLEPNVLSLQIQPEEGIQMRFTTKVPGEDLTAASVTMDFDYERAFDRSLGDAYERLLLDCMRGDATLFARRDEIEEAWHFVTPVLEAWEIGSGKDLARYERGSSGPPEADRLIGRIGRRWRDLS